MNLPKKRADKLKSEVEQVEIQKIESSLLKITKENDKAPIIKILKKRKILVKIKYVNDTKIPNLTGMVITLISLVSKFKDFMKDLLNRIC